MSKQIYILGSGEISEQWRSVFITSGAQDFNVNFVNLTTPSNAWLDSTRRYLTTQQSILLYNHSLIWASSKVPFIILDNNAYPSQSSMIVLDLFKQSFESSNPGIILFGRYNENCRRTTEQSYFESLGQKFILTSTYDPTGAFAYYCNVEAANKLLSLLPNKLLPVDEYLGYWIRRGVKAWSLSPNIVDQMGRHVQCSSQNTEPVLILLTAIVAGIICLGIITTLKPKI